jgi:competence protein ComGC
MKKSKKFILSIIVILIVAVALLLAFPDIFDSGEDINTDLELENVDAIDNPFD